MYGLRARVLINFFFPRLSRREFGLDYNNYTLAKISYDIYLPIPIYLYLDRYVYICIITITEKCVCLDAQDKGIKNIIIEKTN